MDRHLAGFYDLRVKLSENLLSRESELTVDTRQLLGLGIQMTRFSQRNSATAHTLIVPDPGIDKGGGRRQPC